MKRRLFQLGADQAVSSLIGFTLSVYAARNSSASEFGVFAVGYALFWVLLGVSRSFIGEVNLIQGQERSAETRDWRSYSTTASLVSGAVSAVLLFVGCTLIASTDTTWVPWCFAAASPLAIVADAIRYVAFTQETYGDALVLDLVWLCGALLAPPLMAAAGLPAIPSAILGWGLGAALGVGLALGRNPRLRPRVKGSLRWVADRRLTGTQFAADFLAASGIGQVATALVPVVASLTVAGGLRAGYVIIGPLNVAYSAMIVFLIPRIRSSLSSHRALPRPAPVTLCAFSAFCALCALIITLLPDKVGLFFLGESWHAGQAASPMLIVAFTLITLAQVMVQVMRLRGAAALVVRVRLLVSTLQAASILAGAAFFGVVGAATGSALAALVSIAPWWFALTHSRRSFAEDDLGTPELA